MNKMCRGPKGAQDILKVRGRADGKGIYFPDIGIKNGIYFHNFGIRNGTDFQDFGYEILSSDTLSRKTGIRSCILFKKIGIRNRYVFEASMARSGSKSGQVPSPRGVEVSLSLFFATVALCGIAVKLCGVAVETLAC